MRKLNGSSLNCASYECVNRIWSSLLLIWCQWKWEGTSSLLISDVSKQYATTSSMIDRQEHKIDTRIKCRQSQVPLSLSVSNPAGRNGHPGLSASTRSKWQLHNTIHGFRYCSAAYHFPLQPTIIMWSIITIVTSSDQKKTAPSGNKVIVPVAYAAVVTAVPGTRHNSLITP